MESTSLPGRVQLSASSAEILKRNPGQMVGLVLVPRGEIVVKGKVRLSQLCDGCT